MNQKQIYLEMLRDGIIEITNELVQKKRVQKMEQLLITLENLEKQIT